MYTGQAFDFLLGAVGPFDLPLFRAINGWPDSLAPFFVFISECSKWLPVRILLVVMFVALVVHPRTRPVWIVGPAWPIANEVTDWMKAIFQMPRPSGELTELFLRVDRLTSFGTASAHSANMACVATVFWLTLGPRWGIPWAVIAFLTGLSRIYVGVHYPYQVVFGWACGVAVGFGAAALAKAAGERWRQRKARPETEPTDA